MVSFTLLNVWVGWVSLSWISEFAQFLSWLLACWVSLSLMSEYVKFYTPESLSSQFSLMTLGLLSFTLLNVWIRWVLLLWISESAKSLLCFLACWVSLSWMFDYAEFHSPESLSSQSLSYDSWHAEFHSPECLNTLSFTLLNLWIRKVSYHDSWHAELHSRECLSTLSFTLLNLLSKLSFPYLNVM